MNNDTVPARLGRPKLSSRERRSERVVTMVTETEYDALQTIAKKAGTSMSRLCHDLLVKAISTSQPASSDKTQTRDV